MKKTKYQAKTADSNGIIHYTDSENQVWQQLYQRQQQTIVNRACPEFIHGLEKLGMPQDRVPQLAEVSKALLHHTGWQVAQVPAIISTDDFFNLLKNKTFPAATFIRVPEELDYLEEPDIFHEFFGHCPMLTHEGFADFMHMYGVKTLEYKDPADRELLARLFWFTVEFGLIQTKLGLRAYGGGILSSHGETIYAVEDQTPIRKDFDLVSIFRTPYRIDIMQTIYYVIESFDQLYQMLSNHVDESLQEAKSLGEFAPTFAVDSKDTQHDNEEWVTC